MARRSVPALPSWTLPRPRLEELLDVGAGRRLTALVAGAGYGKSTLVARWAEGRGDTVWYSLDPIDRSVPYLVRGMLSALQPVIGDPPPDLRAVFASGSSTADDPDPTRAEAVADLVCELLAERLAGDLVLVLDDVQEIPAPSSSMRLIESILRGAPPTFHLVLISRSALPFPIERLRGQGGVMELAADRLAFSHEETAALLARLGEDAIAVGPELQRSTGGWPAAVRLAAETLVAVEPSERPALIERLGRPEGPLFGYIAEEVLDREPAPVVEFLRVASRLDWFDGSLLESIGVADASTILADLRRRALFIDFDAHDETYSVHGLLRGVVIERLPMTRAESAEVNRRAAAWFEERGQLRRALDACMAADDVDLLVAFLGRHHQRLLSEGVAGGVTRAVERVPLERRTQALELLLADAFIVRAEWDAALRALARAGGAGDRLDPAVGWRLATIHHQRGDLAEGKRVWDQADLDRGDPADVALLVGWRAYASWTVTDIEPLRPLAEQALTIAEETGDDRALGIAYLANAAHMNALGESENAERFFRRSIAAAERAGWALLIARAWNDLGYHLVRQGRCAEALRADDTAVTLLRAIGDASFLALALADRGEAHLGLGHFEEAEADVRESIMLYDRVGSRWKAWPIYRQATLYRLRGDVALARSRYADAVRVAEALTDDQVHSESLAGLALVVARDNSSEGKAIAERALEVGGSSYQLVALGVAAQIALDRGDRAEAARYAGELLHAARRRGDAPSTATALEILAQLSSDDEERRARIDEAEALWRETGSPYGLASSLLVRARLTDGQTARDAAMEAERLFREIGARAMAEEASRLIAETNDASRPPAEVFAFGGFRVLRDGSPVPLGEWQSKKARDLLKILVARRGRPIAREALLEELWPDDAPGPLPARLSVALTTIRTVLDPERRFPPEHYIVADKTAVAINTEHLLTDVESFFRLADHGRMLLDAGLSDDAFESLTAAEAAYGGDFLAEDPYEDWASALRDEAQTTYVAVARALAGLSASRGDVDGAIRLWLRILEKDPFDEEAHLALVGVLIRAGRHGEARRRYGVYAERMTEIGVEASPFPAQVPVHAA